MYALLEDYAVDAEFDGIEYEDDTVVETLDDFDYDYYDEDD